MKLLAEIDDALLGMESAAGGKLRDDYKIRHAARAVIFNDKGDIALLCATRHGYHKLPGGGMEIGEDWTTALIREAMEEVGCDVDVLPQKVGEIIEWRTEFQLKQVSVCGMAQVRGAVGQNSLTEEEIAAGMEVLWVSIDEAIRLLTADNPTDYEGRFIKARDSVFLKEAKGIGR
jgi:8-oxo-dGTP diphosphatase